MASMKYSSNKKFEIEKEINKKFKKLLENHLFLPLPDQDISYQHRSLQHNYQFYCN
jgi:hypothetical protein